MTEWLTILGGSSDISVITNLIESTTSYHGNEVIYKDYSANWDGRRAALTKGGNNLTNNQSTRVAIALLAGFHKNSVFSPDQIINALINYDAYSAEHSRTVDILLYTTKQPYYNLTDSEINQIKKNSINTDSAKRDFLLLVSSYLGRVLTSEDLRGRGSIPIVVVDLTRGGLAESDSKLPKVVLGFVKMYSEVVDFFDDEAKTSKAEVFKSFYNSIVSSYEKDNLEWVKKTLEILRNYILFTLYKSRPINFNVDERVVWLNDVKFSLSNVLLLYFNKKLPHDRSSILQFVEILPQDTIHELTSVLLSVIAGKDIKVSKLTYNDDLQTAVNICLEIRSDNKTTGLSIIDYLDSFLIYASVHGTSKNRCVSYPEEFTIIVKHRRIDLNMKVINKYLAMSKSSKDNYLRRAARTFASRTLLLRKKNNVRSEINKNILDIDPVFNFDTVNFVNDPTLSQHDRNNISKMSIAIRNNNSITNDKINMFTR
ncbi:HSP90-like protein [Citrus associated ampelovirus 2]|nr:HSP90-like protein [Citrus associated ampelovirus 2]